MEIMYPFNLRVYLFKIQDVVFAKHLRHSAGESFKSRNNVKNR